MKTVLKLYIRDFLIVLTVLVAGLSFVFSLVGLIERLDEFMKHRPPVYLLAQYAALSIPRFVRYLLPIAILLSSLFVFSHAVRSREIMALKSSGGRLRRFLVPFLGLGVLLALFGFLVGETLVPPSTKQLEKVKNEITKKGRDITVREGTVYVRGKEGAIIRISLYQPDRDISHGVTIYTFGKDGLMQKISAASAQWEENNWKLNDVFIHDIQSGRTEHLRGMETDVIDSPKLFREKVWNVEEMTITELFQYRKRLHDAGFRNLKLTVDISSRLSFPLVNLLLVILGFSLAVGDLPALFQGRQGSGHPGAGVMTAGTGLMISLLYWFGHSFFLSLGYAGTIPPVIAPWVVPSVLGWVTAYFFLHIPE